MNNFKFKLLIEPNEIYNKLIPKQKQLFDNVQITKATLLDSGDVELECLALSSNITETPYRQVISLSNEKYIAIIDA